MFYVKRSYIPNAIEHVKETARFTKRDLQIEIEIYTDSQVFFWVGSV